jgi:hypothetical protein
MNVNISTRERETVWLCLTLKSDNEFIKSSSSLVADEAYGATGVRLNVLFWFVCIISDSKFAESKKKKMSLVYVKRKSIFDSYVKKNNATQVCNQWKFSLFFQWKINLLKLWFFNCGLGEPRIRSVFVSRTVIVTWRPGLPLASNGAPLK